MLDVKLIDSFGTSNGLKVDENGAISIYLRPSPPRDPINNVLPFRQYFTTTGDSSGSNDMGINGSSTNVDFYISAAKDFDIYIKYISVEIGDGGNPNLNGFGALNALTNGVGWIWFSQEEGEYELHEGIKTNKEFVRIGTDTASIGTGVDAYLADVSGGGSEKSYLPAIDIKESYGMPWGFLLRKSTTEKIVFRVRDNLSNLTTFNIVAFGTRVK